MSVAQKRLAIIGCGSSGLICLKMALNFLTNSGNGKWEIVCYEQSNSITGCWGNPYPGFVSTSTRYATQFACFPICEATVNPDGGACREEFFRDGEYGEYLELFANEFNLRSYIQLNHRVENLTRNPDGTWQLSVQGSIKKFDAVVICTGLAAKPKPIDSDVPQLSADDLNQPGGLNHIQNKKIVVMGGGESAVDYANRLAKKALNNEVFLSLHSGVRVSPRYHPVRGVPSDFLRNRLMLSVHPDIRNRLGQIFVEWRIKYQRQFEKLFPNKNSPTDNESLEDESAKRSKEWALKLTLAAKDDLFNMFHNKSDDFLEAVGDQRIKIVGGAVDSACRDFFQFDSEERVIIEPDLLVPAIGYKSTLEQLSDSKLKLADFHLGCCHAQHRGLYLVGFARPIIGNIPTISEMQARYIFGLIAGEFQKPTEVELLQKKELALLHKRYAKLNLESVYPVEMFPYCDKLARLMSLPVGKGWRSKLAPATTMHYFGNDPRIQKVVEPAPIYMPVTLILFILMMKPVDWLYRMIR